MVTSFQSPCFIDTIWKKGLQIGDATKSEIQAVSTMSKTFSNPRLLLLFSQGNPNNMMKILWFFKEFIFIINCVLNARCVRFSGQISTHIFYNVQPYAQLASAVTIRLVGWITCPVESSWPQHHSANIFFFSSADSFWKKPLQCHFLLSGVPLDLKPFLYRLWLQCRIQSRSMFWATGEMCLHNMALQVDTVFM